MPLVALGLLASPFAIGAAGVSLLGEAPWRSEPSRLSPRIRTDRADVRAAAAHLVALSLVGIVATLVAARIDDLERTVLTVGSAIPLAWVLALLLP